MKTQTEKTIGDLAGAMFALAIAQACLPLTLNPMLEEMYKDRREIIRKLKRKGLVVVEIIDKGSIETYHEKEGIKETIEKFLKMNEGKWVVEEDRWDKIKTGKIILRRVYRRYIRKL